MDNLIIEVGKYYKTREGQKVKIYSMEGNHPNYPIHGAILWDAGWGVEQWTKERFYFWPERECKLDIISEWTEPHPAESWEVDKKILVSDDGEIWAKRHFSKFENGAVYTWPSGLTSWSNTSVFPSFEDDMAWKFAKPAEENK